MASQPPGSMHRSPEKRIWRSLQHRNFRLFFLGQGISLIGTWMQQLAMAWLVYQLTDDPLKMGAVTFASQIPSFLLVPFVGVLLDHWNKHRVIVLAQALALIQALLLAILVFAEVITFWQIILLSVFQGCVNAFDMPARQSFLPEMLTSKEDLGNAIALNSSLFNGARLLGPALAGFLIYLVGEAMCFLLNALSYLAVIAALLAMKIPKRPRRTHKPQVLLGLKEGFVYAFGFPPIRALLLLVAMVSFAGIPYTVLMPLFAKDILGGGAATLGLLMTAAGLGALTGALYMAARASVLGLGTRIVLACSLAGGALLGFAHSEMLWLSLALLALAGLGIMVTMAGCNTILQTLVDDDKRGRVMSIYTMAFMGMAPFGSLLAGGLANWVGAPWTVFGCGVSFLIVTVLFGRRMSALRAMVRPIYIEKGILPPPVPAMETAPELFVAGEEMSAVETSAKEDNP
jgi:MFS family permease